MIDYFLADDLSGALDAAAAFHRTGRRVRVVLSADSWRPEPDDEVVGVTTETRNATGAAAAAAVARAIAHGREQGARLAYKKIDSTLRGPVAAELEALAAALPDARILFAPANPAVGRTVADGRLLVHGVPVAETEFGRDPVCPVTHSALRVFADGIPPERIRIPDTQTAADLADAVHKTVAAGGDWVAVGSGALARPVAEGLSTGRAVRSAPRPVGGDIPAGGGVLLVAGSAHPANRAQAAVLAERLRTSVIELHPEDCASARDAALRALSAHACAILQVDATRRDSSRVLEAVTATILQILERSLAGRLFVTGGETAFTVCRNLGVTSLEYLDEVEPGLSVSSTVGGRMPLLLAVKPGGFGDAETWVRAWRALGGDGR